MKTKYIESSFEYLMWANSIAHMQIESHDFDLYIYLMTGEL